MTTDLIYKTQLRFAHALSIVRSIPPNSTLQPIVGDKLQFYSLYKQASEGDINIPKPSSKQVIDYAKWKAWSRMKGMSPIEAQKLYVESLIQLLTELIHRYPHHEQIPFLKKALRSLTIDEDSLNNKTSNNGSQQEEEDLFQDAYDPTEFELEENFLNHFEPEQLMQETHLLNSPPINTRPTYYNSHRHHSFSEFSHTQNDYPLTPMTSPGQNSATNQWVLSQIHHQNNKLSSYVQPMDLLLLQQQQQQQQHQRQQQQHHLQQHDLLSEPDTIDREVAATTANLALKSPTHSPYSKKKHHSKQKRNHSNTTTSSTSTTSMANKKTSDRALEKLQTEVTALTEQIDRLRSGIKLREERDRQKLNWSAWKIIKLLLKHLLANSVIFLIVFYVLWRKKSPLAYGILSYIMPIVQEIMRKVLRKVIFWKVAILK